MLKKIFISAMLILPLVLPACEKNGLDFKIRFDQVQGLKKGDSVIFEQNHIGLVDRVVYTGQGNFLVDVNISANFTPTATEHSRFFIISNPMQKNSKAIEIKK